MVDPNQPSSRARKHAYSKMIKLFNLLRIFRILPWDAAKDTASWKAFVIDNIPLDKRGGPKTGLKDDDKKET
jgi:hypothetical protein